MDRPLFVALLAGWLTGDWALALPLGMICELFWLDVLELGSVVAPSGSFAFLLLFPLAHLWGLAGPDQLAVPLLLSLLLGNLVAWAEQSLRVRQNKLVEQVAAHCAGMAMGLAPAAAVGRMALQRALIHFSLYGVCFGLLLLTMHTAHILGIPTTIPVTGWGLLLVIALPGAALTLRTRNLYLVLLAGLAFCVVSNFAA